MPASSAIYEEIPAELRERVEDVMLNRRPDATERLLEIAEIRRRRAAGQGGQDLAGATRRSTERLDHALVNGIDEYIDAGHRRSAPAVRAPDRR